MSEDSRSATYIDMTQRQNPMEQKEHVSHSGSQRSRQQSDESWDSKSASTASLQIEEGAEMPPTDTESLERNRASYSGSQRLQQQLNNRWKSESVSSSSLQIEEGAELPATDAESETESDTHKPAAAARELPKRAPILLPSLIVPFSILGLLIRLGLVSIETFSGQQVFALAWPQFIGCVLMGLFVTTRAWIEEGFVKDRSRRKGHWIGAFIYVALSSGLCGSITTFSSWSLGVFVELINPSKIQRHVLQNILSGISELIVTLAVSMSGLQMGAHLGQAVLQHIRTEAPPAASVPSTTTPSQDTQATATKDEAQLKRAPTQTLDPIRPLPPTHWTVLDAVIVSSAIIIWIGMILAAIFTPEGSQSSWRHVVLAICFAPPGAILRWYLSRLNPRMKKFPLGTFAANIGGSMFLAVIVCLQHSPVAGGKSALACQVLSGLQDGFCGCLTTISTFVLELKTLPRRSSYIYGLVSIVAAQLGMFVVLGSFVWTRRSTVEDDNVYQHDMCSM
ncbi:CrcB-like protein-domain-containing protein [Gamsiella multidivaricata]|uniref:CrcB-like protein-domain-containing protein n=1 Tax=Gamsiella multidivaricata TaxID=101098 RepID=UPI00221EC43E|nr:CrcB-like protein-domain-containing protein [Gamsiella multidivaricata]KAG0364623.1 hypothetical protein BGZ54_007325 [Gamsiella multidivaricata]KAI7821227.1 CrcB-like protein-domain-containing protein [Gamsiella multidivaricata]